MRLFGSNRRLIDQMPSNEAGFAQSPSPNGIHAAPVLVLSTAELAECTCPEYCERDHDTD
jgi:hypothetical protein